MLFNSYPFLFVYLPMVLLGYQVASRFGSKAVVVWLGLASVAFYTYWYPPFLWVLGSSILWNFLFSRLISRAIPSAFSTKTLLWVAITGDLGALCWFKYLFPTLNFFAAHAHMGKVWANVALPLGISFFTFTQIGYLVDLQQGAAEQQVWWNYLVFVTFFPHLIAGPILHHKDMMPQFQRDPGKGLRWHDISVGATWFAMGLFKKAVLADPIAVWVDVAFHQHGLMSSGTAWLAVLGYTLQLYFDFSGYCDMACGLARMFSIDFPLNFASPYKATNITDFWQRWHMTLTQYIGAYLYSPVQFWVSARRQNQGKKVSRKAQKTAEGFTQMIAAPTIFTMFLAGVWHGAGMQFLVFGLLHGVYLTVNRGWALYRHGRTQVEQRRLRKAMGHAAAVLLTVMCWSFSLVFFRSESLHDAVAVLQRMAFVPVHGAEAFALGARMLKTATVVGLFAWVWLLPNTQQVLERYKPALELSPSDQQPAVVPIRWAPTVWWSLAMAAVMMCALIGMQNPSTFLYFQF